MPYPGLIYPGALTFPGASPPRDITLTATLADGQRFTATLGADVPRIIDVTEGAVEYVTVTVAETAGQAITGAGMVVGLGGYTAAPATWLTADVTTQLTTSTVELKLLVGTGHYAPPAGRYFCWVKVTDAPEIVPVVVRNRTITIT